MKTRKTAAKKSPGPSPAASSKISPADFPALRQFLRGYLHQDWKAEHDSPAQAAQQFCEDASPPECGAVAREWEAFRKQTKNLSLPAISGILSAQLGAAWDPQDPGQLEAISSVFRPFAGKM
jgi:hypothetical protein